MSVSYMTVSRPEALNPDDCIGLLVGVDILLGFAKRHVQNASGWDFGV